jgi:hypothetical protein
MNFVEILQVLSSTMPGAWNPGMLSRVPYEIVSFFYNFHHKEEQLVAT